MSQGLLLGGLVCWALGALVDLVFGADRRWGRITPYVAGLVGAGAVTAAGVSCVLAPVGVVNLGATLAVGETSLRLDALAGLFLTLAGGLGVALSACLVGWAWPPGRVEGRGTGSGYLLLLGAVTVVLVAGDAFTFLFGWETLSVAFYVLTGLRRSSRDQARASWVTVGVGKASGAALLIGFLLLAGRTNTFTLAAWAGVQPGALHDAAFALLVVGFGAKVGLMPFQVWLPVGYPAAPGPTRAAMAGLAANVGFYGLWRFLGILGHPPVWLAAVLLLAGGATALLGIVFAAVQSRLDRVIAYSSVENAGIILVGYGVALVGAAIGKSELMAVGLLAGSLQVLSHAVAKSALFASSAFFESDYGTDDLELLHGVGHRHRVSGATFGLGALTLAGLPPTIGFVSEWFILEALLQEFRVHDLVLRLSMATAGALVALTAGVAALTFVRLLGLTILGHRPSGDVDRPVVRDGGVFGGGGMVVLAVSCLGLSAAAPWVVRFVARGLGPIVAPSAILGALRSPWVLQPVFPGFSILSPSWLFVAMPVGFIVVALATLMLSRGGILKVRRVPAWRSATAGAAGPAAYSSFGYANVLRHVLGNLLGSRRSTVVVGESLPGAIDSAARIEVRSTVVEPVEEYLYRPGRVALGWVVRGAKRLQAGRLDAYIGYMLIALLAVLVVVAVMH